MNEAAISTPIALDFESRTVRKVQWRILPFVGCLYLIAIIDRVNVGYATLQMGPDLGFDPEVIGFGAGIFFFGYFLLEIPGTLLVELWSARKWIARILISWGIIAVLMGFIQNSTQFYIARFLLGLGEAGFFPGVIVYLTHWFRDQDRVKAVSIFYIGSPVAQILGAPIAGVLLGFTWLGLAGWRWLFILEGIPAIVFGVITLFYLTDRPSQAKWLTAEESGWLADELARERNAKLAAQHFSIWQAFKNRNVVLLTLGYFCGLTAIYGVTFWLPTIIKRLSGFSTLEVSLISMLPYCFGLVSMLIVGWSLDKRPNKRPYVAAVLAALCVGLFLSAAAGGNLYLSLAMLCLAGAAMYCFVPTFWSLPVSFLTQSAAAASVGMINSFGNLGGFVGPYIVGYLTKATNSTYGGMVYLSLSALVGAAFILMIQKKVLSPVLTERG